MPTKILSRRDSSAEDGFYGKKEQPPSVLQDGVLTVGGRLSRSAMPAQAAILPKNHHVTQLIIRQIHENTGHSGRNYTLSHLRQRYWVPSANAAIRKLVAKCVVCRGLSGSRGEQHMADLPVDRVTPDHPPFTNVGVDFFGPFEVKCGRKTVKRYGVIFTSEYKSCSSGGGTFIGHTLLHKCNPNL